MAYYTALIAAWNNVTQPPPGVAGTALTGLTTANKIIAVNGWTVPSPQLAIIPVNSIMNAIQSADFLALTSLQLQQIQFMFGATENGQGTILAPPGSTIRTAFGSIFAGKTTTLNNLTALLAPFDNATQLWVTANGYGTAINSNDVAAAGLS